MRLPLFLLASIWLGSEIVDAGYCNTCHMGTCRWVECYGGSPSPGGTWPGKKREVEEGSVEKGEAEKAVAKRDAVEESVEKRDIGYPGETMPSCICRYSKCTFCSYQDNGVQWCREVPNCYTGGRKRDALSAEESEAEKAVAKRDAVEGAVEKREAVREKRLNTCKCVEVGTANESCRQCTEAGCKKVSKCPNGKREAVEDSIEKRDIGYPGETMPSCICRYSKCTFCSYQDNGVQWCREVPNCYTGGRKRDALSVDEIVAKRDAENAIEKKVGETCKCFPHGESQVCQKCTKHGCKNVTNCLPDFPTRFS